LAFNVEMGTDKLIEAELYSPVLSSQTLFVAGRVGYSSEDRNLPLPSLKTRTSAQLTTSYPFPIMTLLQNWRLAFNLRYGKSCALVLVTLQEILSCL
ncbi:hypothetical protein, partial [Staphylococcus aureus]|uniref:hypothetical protein n=1 Tax=Staphylococcus aureus TaxID=1280 RepID=UPI00301C9BF6